MGLKKTRIAQQISVPFFSEERQRFDAFLSQKGLKKGAFVRAAILEKLDRDESRS